jgi:hypothetical protein
MPGFYRAVFYCKGKPGYSLTIDLAVRGDNKVSKDIVTSGWWGNSESDDVWPFIFRTDGEMDFGNDSANPFSSAVRYGHLYIHDKLIDGDKSYRLTYEKESFDLTLFDLKNHNCFHLWKGSAPSTSL